MRILRARRAGASIGVVLAVVALLAAGCAADVPEADPADDGADALVWTGDEVDLTDVDLAIGSKDSTEQELLGWVAVEAARAAGATVHPEIAAGGTAVVRQAQLSGLIDAYWEYTGTGWTRILQQGDPAGTSGELYEAVRDRDHERNQIEWLPPAPLNSAYAIAASPATIDDLGIRTLADLADALEEADETGPSLCVDETSGFADDPDGLRQFERAFDVSVTPGAELPTDDLYEQVEAGVFCTFGQVLNTDPRLADGSLQVLEDAGTFTIYNPSFTIREDVAEDYPEVADLVAQLAPRLTDEVLRELQAQVELEGESARSVARRWLQDEGLAEAPTDDGQEQG